MMRYEALYLHVDPVRTEITGMQKILISHVCNSDKSLKSVLQTRINHKALYLIKFLRRRANQKAFTKVSKQIKKIRTRNL